MRRTSLGFYVKDGIVSAAAGLNRGGHPDNPKGGSELKAAAKLIRDHAPVDPARLADVGMH